MIGIKIIRNMFTTGFLLHPIPRPLKLQGNNHMQEITETKQATHQQWDIQLDIIKNRIESNHNIHMILEKIVENMGPFF